jgi:hypothetical protein
MREYDSLAKLVYLCIHTGVMYGFKYELPMHACMYVCNTCISMAVRLNSCILAYTQVSCMGPSMSHTCMYACMHVYM